MNKETHKVLTKCANCVIIKLERLERCDMGKVGIIKEFDKLGRLVIPKDLRERYAMDNKVEIVATEQGILLKSPEYKLVKREEGD